jgi:hypothetical protein
MMVNNHWLVIGGSIQWEESSQLTFIFFRGVETTNQKNMEKEMSFMVNFHFYRCLYVFISFSVGIYPQLYPYGDGSKPIILPYKWWFVHIHKPAMI